MEIKLFNTYTAMLLVHLMFEYRRTYFYTL